VFAPRQSMKALLLQRKPRLFQRLDFASSFSST
jgi:hypothetical protein